MFKKIDDWWDGLHDVDKPMAGLAITLGIPTAMAAVWGALVLLDLPNPLIPKSDIVRAVEVNVKTFPDAYVDKFFGDGCYFNEASAIEFCGGDHFYFVGTANGKVSASLTATDRRTLRHLYRWLKRDHERRNRIAVSNDLSPQPKKLFDADGGHFGGSGANNW